MSADLDSATAPRHGAATQSGAALHSDVEELLDALAADRGREAVVHRDRRITAGELVDSVHRLAHTLDGRVESGRVVALLAGNTPGRSSRGSR